MPQIFENINRVISCKKLQSFYVFQPNKTQLKCSKIVKRKLQVLNYYELVFSISVILLLISLLKISNLIETLNYNKFVVISMYTHVLVLKRGTAEKIASMLYRTVVFLRYLEGNSISILCQLHILYLLWAFRDKDIIRGERFRASSSFRLTAVLLLPLCLYCVCLPELQEFKFRSRCGLSTVLCTIQHFFRRFPKLKGFYRIGVRIVKEQDKELSSTKTCLDIFALRNFFNHMKFVKSFYVI